MADDELVRLLVHDPNNPLLKQRDAQMWGGLGSHMPDQPDIMKSAQGLLGRGLAAVPPEALLMMQFLSRSPRGAAIGRDNVMARRLENKANTAEGYYDRGITGGLPGRIRDPSDWDYPPIAKSSTGLLHDPGMNLDGSVPRQFQIGSAERALDPKWSYQQPANEIGRRFEVIPGGKK